MCLHVKKSTKIILQKENNIVICVISLMISHAAIAIKSLRNLYKEIDRICTFDSRNHTFDGVQIRIKR